MSLKTWKLEFYPISAQSAKLKTMKQRIEYSLTKWKGLSASSLKKHKLTVNRYWIRSYTRDEYLIDGDNCALCVHYFSKNQQKITVLLVQFIRQLEILVSQYILISQ